MTQTFTTTGPFNYPHTWMDEQILRGAAFLATENNRAITLREVTFHQDPEYYELFLHDNLRGRAVRVRFYREYNTEDWATTEANLVHAVFLAVIEFKKDDGLWGKNRQEGVDKYNVVTYQEGKLSLWLGYGRET